MTRGRCGGWLRTIAGSETLDELPPVRSGRSRPSVFAWIFTPEDLPSDTPVEGKSRVSLFSLLLSSESLPEDHVPDDRLGRRSFLAVLFSPERLPEDPVAEKVQGNRCARR